MNPAWPSPPPVRHGNGLILNMAGLEREEFRVLYLNNQNQLIAGETLFTGTINRTEVHPREVIKRALYHNAAAVVLAHDHPSGEVTPSKADRLITNISVRLSHRWISGCRTIPIVGGNQVFVLCRTWSALTRHNHITPVFLYCFIQDPIMKIITRGEAMRIHRQHPASRLFPFCTGRSAGTAVLKRIPVVKSGYSRCAGRVC